MKASDDSILLMLLTEPFILISEEFCTYAKISKSEEPGFFKIIKGVKFNDIKQIYVLGVKINGD
jgi:hypothetical protein